MLRKLYIKDLFGLKSNNKIIEFKEDLTIIVGKNGSGKTTVLNILNAIITKSFYKLLDYDFSEINLLSDEGNIFIKNDEEKLIIKRLDVKKSLKERGEQYNKNVVNKMEELIKLDEPKFYTNFKDQKIDEKFSNTISSFYIEFLKDGDKLNKMQNLSNRFVYNVKSLYFPTYRRTETDFMEIIKDFNKKLTRFPTFYFDEHYIELANEFGNIVVGLSNKDISTIVLKKWNSMSETEKNRLNDLVKQFFFSLLEPPSTSPFGTLLKDFDAKQVKAELMEVLIRTGLMEKRDKNWIDRIEEYFDNANWAKQFLKTVTKQDKKIREKEIETFDKAFNISLSFQNISKLVEIYRKTASELDEIRASFRNLKEKLEEFLDKKVEIQDGELRFIHKNATLHFEDLSAGEKQLVALFVYTRLYMDDGSTIIIDEPELSLHVVWQRKFLAALTSENRNMQYIVSTHSPFIISNFREKIQVLGDMEEGEIGE